MKIFLAGATGAIGRLLLPMLIDAGHSVTGTTRHPDRMAGIERADGKAVLMDAFNREGLFRALQTEKPDVVIHQLTDLAGLDFASNSRLRIEGGCNLVDASKAVGVQRMIAQSISWVSVAGDKPATEDEPLDLQAPAPRGRMVMAVQALELAVAEMPVGIVLRYGLLYGPGTWYSRDERSSQQIHQGEIAATDAVSSFVHVADAARAAMDAIEWPAGIYNIVDDAPAQGVEWVPLYAQLIGALPPPVKPGREGWERGASNEKARRLGWRPHYPDWREGYRAVLSQ